MRHSDAGDASGRGERWAFELNGFEQPFSVLRRREELVERSCRGGDGGHEEQQDEQSDERHAESS
jgi:hypothetical protein